MTASRAIPVTVLTGFLGAGKTTRLNRLLKHPDLADTAVLINEFGEIGLGHLLVDAANGAATLDPQPEAVRHAAVADRLLLTKTDLAGAEATSALVARRGSLNPGAPLRRALESCLADDA
jgi:G3E family GTPase